MPALVLGALVVVALDQESGLRSWLSLRESLRDSRTQVGWLEGELGRLRRDGSDLVSDPLAVERTIREELGLARPGEVVVLFPDSASPTY